MNCDVGEVTKRLENEQSSRKGWRMSCDVGEAMERLENEQSSQLQSQQSLFSNLSVTSPTSQLILQHLRCFIYVTAHSPSLPSLHLIHKSFKIWSQILSDLHLLLPCSTQWMTMNTYQGCCFLMKLCSFSNLSVTSLTSQLILQPFRRFISVRTHSPTLPLLHLHHSSFPTLTSLLLRHRLFTYVNWRAAHEPRVATKLERIRVDNLTPCRLYPRISLKAKWAPFWTQCILS